MFSELPLLCHLASLVLSLTKIHTEAHKRLQKKSISLRGWWWDNYGSTVLPVPSLHTKWLSWCYKFHPCHQPQPLPRSSRLKVACSCSGSVGNTFAHTCSLFIFNRCWVEGPVQNGCHLSSINNSVTQAKTQTRNVQQSTHTPTPYCMKCHLTCSHLAFILFFRQPLLFTAVWLQQSKE